MPPKSITYAEEALGVHQAYTEAVGAADALHNLHEQLKRIGIDVRRIKEQIAQREVDVYTEEGSKHPTMSKTALQDHVKVTRQNDPELTRLRGSLNDFEQLTDNLKYDVRECEFTIKIREARMIELGGYFNYLAVTKQMSPTSPDKTNGEEQ